MEQLRIQQEELLKEITTVQELLASPGWMWLERTLKANLTVVRRGVFEAEINSLDMAFGLAAAQGRAAGLQIAIATPMGHLLDLEADMESVQTQIEEAQDE